MASLTSSLLVKLVDGVSGPAKKMSGALAGIGNAARGISGAQARLAASVEKNNAALAAARGKMVDAVAIGYALQRAFTAPVKAGIDFQTQLEDIGQKADIPQEKLAALGKQIRAVAKDTNQAASQMATGLDTLVGFGAKEDDALKLLRPIGRAATAYRAEVNDLAKAGFAALDNLKVPAVEFGLALDAMAQAGKEGAFELRDMAQYFPALGAAYQGLGQKGVPAVADLAAALQVVRKGAGDSAEAATNLKNILQKLNSPETRQKFKKLGIELEKEMAKAAKKGQTPIEAIAEITNRALKGNLGRLGDLFQDAQVQLGLRPLIQNIEEYRRIRAEAMKAQGVVEEDYARRLKTTQGFVQRFRATIENLNTSLGTALLPTINDVADKLSMVAARLAEFAEAHPALTRNIVLATAGLLGFRVAMAGISFLALQVKGAILQVASAALVAARGMWALLASMARFAVAPIIAGLRGLRTAMIGYAAAASIAGHGTALAMMGRSLLGLLNPLRLVRGAFVALRFAFLATGIGAAIAAIAAAGTFIYNNWQGIKELFAGIADGFAKGLGPAAEYLRPVADLAKKVWDAISGVLGPLDASNEKWRSWGATIGEVAGGGVRRIIEAIGWLVDKLSQAWDAAKRLAGALGFGGASPAAPAAASAPAPAVAGKRARGGPVAAGRPYLVGEEGPEIITPARSGFVHPNGSGVGSFNPTISVENHFHGITDLDEIACKIDRALADGFRESLRGLYADYGLTITG